MKTEHMPGINVSYNLSGLNGLEEKNEQFLNEMIRLFIKSTASGMQEMQSALKEQDWKKVGDKAHKMLGPCKHLEVMPLTNTLKSIEKDIFELEKTDEIPALVKQAKDEADETIKVFEKLISK
jgi:HPt (histidine-containing phosphotransfer) domain-containing protein